MEQSAAEEPRASGERVADISARILAAVAAQAARKREAAGADRDLSLEDAAAPVPHAIGRDADRTRARIAELIRDARVSANLSQGQLAARCGVSQGMLSAYERARRTPSLDTVDRILAALGLQLAVATEPLWAGVDAAIDEARAAPLEERLGARGGMLAALVERFAGIPHVVEGLAATALLGLRCRCRGSTSRCRARMRCWTASPLGPGWE